MLETATIRTKAINLRREKRLPATEIAKMLGVKIETCRDWLVGLPLTKEEKRAFPRTVRKSLVGQRFGRLLVVERRHKYEAGSKPKILYKCACDCGKEVVRAYCNLKGRDTQSCGCLRKEVLHKRKQSDFYIHISNVGCYYRRNARPRGFEFSLTRTEIEDIVVRPCHYCGYDSSFVGIDRVDNSKGYVQENIVPCCKICNHAKSDLSLSDFLAWAQRLAKTQRIGTIDA